MSSFFILNFTLIHKCNIDKKLLEQRVAERFFYYSLQGKVSRSKLF